MKKTINCFMDFEFTSSGNRAEDLKNNGIELISLAGIFTDENFNIIEEYYSLVKPCVNTQISLFCKKLTGITQNEILNSRDFHEVINEFCLIIEKFSDFNINYFTWGDFDNYGLRKSIKINSYKGAFNSIYKKIKNIQPEISKKIKYKGKVLKTHWGLQDVKQIYNMDASKNIHNALSDARDLNSVYKAYKNNTSLNIQFLKEYNQKITLNKEIERQKNIINNKKINEELFSKIQLINISNNIYMNQFKQFHKEIDFNKYNETCTIIFHKNTIHFENNKLIPNTLFIPFKEINILIQPKKILSTQKNIQNNEFNIEIIFIIRLNYSDIVNISYIVPIKQNTRKYIKNLINSLN